MNRTTFHVEKMDCAAEEHLVRMRLEREPAVERLAFDLAARHVTVIHTGDTAAIRAALAGLGLGAREVAGAAVPDANDGADAAGERRALATLGYAPVKEYAFFVPQPVLVGRFRFALSVLAGMAWMGTREVWRDRHRVAWSVAISTLYLWAADRAAIRNGVWAIADGTRLGLDPFGLPVEEATFFLATNALCVAALAMLLPHPAVSVQPAARRS